MPKYLDMHGLETLTGEIEATYLRKNKRGAANGVASLDSNGKVPVSQIPGGAGGTTDYDDLTDKPQINGTTLSGNKTSANLGIHDIPSGGTTGQVLAKSSDSNYAVQWVNQQGGGGGTTDYADLDNKPQINGTTLSGNKTTANLGIHDVPSGGSTGQVLAKHSGTDHDVEWVTPAEPASTDEIVVVSDTTPTDPDARIWFPETQPQGIEIPTYPEFQEVAQDVSELKTEINSKTNELKSAFNDETEYLENKLDAVADATTDQTETVTRTDFTPAWALGVCLLDGTTSASTGYAYTTTTQIDVKMGDKITCGDSRDVSKASMRYVTCYNGSTVQPDKGAESTTEFTVPAGVNRVVVTASSGAMTNSYYIKRYRPTVTYAMKDNLAKYEAEEMHGWEE